jgi:hypothetical protein
VRLGRDVRLLVERADGLELEGRARLAPGRPVDIVLASATGGGADTVRPAVVWTWTLVRVGSAGALYRGLCRWTGSAGP